MSKNQLITGITVSEQMSKANEILKKQVLPREQKFQKRKLQGKLSNRLLLALKSNA